MQPPINFKYLFESAPGLYLVLLPDLTIVAVSDAYLQATMTQKEVILGRELFDVFPDNPNDPAATGVSNLKASLNYVLQHAKPHIMAVQKYDIRRPDGSFEERFWSPLNTPVFNEKKKVTYIIHRVEDVTEIMRLKNEEIKQTKKKQETKKKLWKEIAERKRAEEQTRESEEQIQTIFNAAPDAVIVINEEGAIVKWNPKAEVLFGWKAEEVMGKLLAETIIPHRYREAHKKGIKHFLQTGEGPVLNKAIEIHAINKNNIEFDAALSISPTVVNDKYLFIGFIRDITDRKQAEALIQKQKQDIQDFIDSMSTLSVKLSTAGKILMVNKIALQASGLSMEELLKTNFTEGQWWTFNPEVHTRVREVFKKACSGTAINYDENIFVFGHVLTINFSLIPILKPDGSVDYIVGEGRDITAQKKAEEKIKESEHMFSTLFYKSPIMKAIAEAPTGRYIEVNDAFADFFEQPKEEILGKTSLELNMLVHSEERDKILKNLQRDGFARDVETQINSKNGKTRWVSTSIDAINLNGKDCFLTAAIDITARKEAEDKVRQMNLELENRVEEKTRETIQSEKRFRNLIENSTDIISLTDQNFKALYRSPSAERLTGWTNEEWEKLGGVELFNPDDFARMKILMKEILKNPHKQFHLTFRHRHKDGHYIWLDGMMTNMLHDETIKAIVFNLRNVTANKEAEEEIKTLNESLEKKVIERTAQLEAVNKELEAFTYSVSHDLRAPLRIIDGYTEMLVSDYQNKLDEEAKRMFGIITGNVRKMGQLIDDLLNLSQTGRKELLLYPADMNKLVQSIIDEQLSLNEENPADIKIETLLPAECDSGLLQQVWSNLISNAIKYSGKQEKPVIRINSFRQNGEIIYQIKDNGVGFDMKYAGQLFGVFQRLHKATEFEGTGVGLALVKRIVAKHNGRVWAESEPGKGAVFFFSLPAY